MTSFFAWNICGFNKPHKHLVLKKWVRDEKLLFVCLLKTRGQESKCQEIVKVAYQVGIL